MNTGPGRIAGLAAAGLAAAALALVLLPVTATGRAEDARAPGIVSARPAPLAAPPSAAAQPDRLGPGAAHTTLVVEYRGHAISAELRRGLADLQAEGLVSAVDADSAAGRVFVLGKPDAVLALRDLPGIVSIISADAQLADEPIDQEVGTALHPTIATAVRDGPAHRPGVSLVDTSDPATSPGLVAANGFITGIVTAADSFAPLTSVSACAYHPTPYAYNCGLPNASGVYSVSVPPGSNYRVSFIPYDGRYIPEYYDNVPYNNPSGYTPVSVSDSAVTANVNAGLAPGAQVIGRVTDQATGNPLSGIYVQVQESSAGYYYASSTTDANGVYTTTPGLPPGSHWVQFIDFSGVYATEYYTNAYRFDLATLIDVTTTHRTGIDAALSPGGTLSGTVTAEGSGAPLNNIYVTAYDAVDGNFINSDSTDAAGVYRFGGLAPIEYKLQFVDFNDVYVPEYYNNKRDFASADPVSVTSGMTTTINAQLALGGVISGMVTAEGSGAPLSNVSVTAYDAATDSFIDSNATNVSGTFRIGGLTTGNYKLRFRDNTGAYLTEFYNNKPDLAGADPFSVMAGMTTTINAQLALGGVISGMVTAEGSGAPLSNVSVTAYNATTGSSIGSNTTNAAGLYRIGSLATGNYKLRFRDNTGAYLTEFYNNKPDLASADPFSVTAGMTTTIHAALAAGGRVTGRVTDAASGAGLADVFVSASRLDASTPSGSALSDANGYYTTTALYTGVYYVQFSPPKPHFAEYYHNQLFFSGFTPVTVTAPLTTTNVNAALSTGYLISGTVTGSGPLASVFVQAYEGANSFYSASDGTDGSGNYQIGPLFPGQYRVYFEPSDAHVSEWYSDAVAFAAAQAINLTSDVTGVNADLAQGGSITGTVTGAGGAPLPGVSVEVHLAGGADSVAFGFTNANGRYTTEPGLTTGAYQVFFDAPTGYTSEWYNNQSSQATASAISVTFGATTPNVNAQLASYTSGAITGTLTAADTSLPLAMWVYAYDPANNYVNAVFAVGGRYVLSGLPPNVYRLYFAASSPYLVAWYNGKPDFVSANPVTVTAGVTTTHINQVFQRGGTITGTVTGSGGVPAVFVAAQRMAGGYFYRSAYSGVDGGYRLEGLAPGSYRVQFTPPSPFVGEWYDNAPTAGAFLTVTVATNATTPNVNAILATGSVITGVITAADTSAPLPGAYTTIHSATTGAFVSDVYADMDGEYQTPGLPAGAYKVYVDARSWLNYIGEWYNNASSFGAALTITVPGAGTTANINVALARGGSISGFAYDGVTGLPLSNLSAYFYDTPSGNIANFVVGNNWGFYQSPGLPSGQYKVWFFRSGYWSQYYTGTTDFDSAVSVSVNAPNNTPNINVYLRPYIRVYLPILQR